MIHSDGKGVRASTLSCSVWLHCYLCHLRSPRSLSLFCFHHFDSIDTNTIPGPTLSPIFTKSTNLTRSSPLTLSLSGHATRATPSVHERCTHRATTATAPIQKGSGIFGIRTICDAKSEPFPLPPSLVFLQRPLPLGVPRSQDRRSYKARNYV
jgi:hypothetical protein